MNRAEVEKRSEDAVVLMVVQRVKTGVLETM